MFNPTYHETVLSDGSLLVEVTPHPAVGTKKHEVRIMPNQTAAYHSWRSGTGLIQNMLPGLSDEQREILISGVSDRDWRDLDPSNCDHLEDDDSMPF